MSSDERTDSGDDNHEDVDKELGEILDSGDNEEKDKRVSKSLESSDSEEDVEKMDEKTLNKTLEKSLNMKLDESSDDEEGKNVDEELGKFLSDKTESPDKITTPHEPHETKKEKKKRKKKKIKPEKTMNSDEDIDLDDVEFEKPKKKIPPPSMSGSNKKQLLKMRRKKKGARELIDSPSTPTPTSIRGKGKVKGKSRLDEGLEEIYLKRNIKRFRVESFIVYVNVFLIGFIMTGIFLLNLGSVLMIYLNIAQGLEILMHFLYILAELLGGFLLFIQIFLLTYSWIQTFKVSHYLYRRNEKVCGTGMDCSKDSFELLNWGYYFNFLRSLLFWGLVHNIIFLVAKIPFFFYYMLNKSSPLNQPLFIVIPFFVVNLLYLFFIFNGGVLILSGIYNLYKPGNDIKFNGEGEKTPFKIIIRLCFSDFMFFFCTIYVLSCSACGNYYGGEKRDLELLEEKIDD